MVTRWACAVNRGKRVVIAVFVNHYRSVTFGANVVGIVFERRWGCLNFLEVPNDDWFDNVNHGGKYWRSRKNAWCWWREWQNFAK
jgi:hypothetical protein